MSATTAPAVVGERRWVNQLLGLAAWLVGLLFFFPVFWMVLNSFKSEQDANTSPKLFFDPTLERYREVTRSAIVAITIDATTTTMLNDDAWPNSQPPPIERWNTK